MPAKGAKCRPNCNPANSPPLRRRAAGDGVVLERVSFTYRPAHPARGAGAEPPRVHALAEVSLHAAPGELLAVVGPSGCGKSTLLELICGLQRPDGGSIECAAGRADAPARPAAAVAERGRQRGAGAAHRRALARPGTRPAQPRCSPSWASKASSDARPHELSGGMRQRVAFLRTLLSGKPLLCLDEPFGALDAITRAEMQEWLARNARARAAHGRARDPRRRGGGPARRPRGRALARPGRVIEQLDVELARPRARTDPEVLALRERALGILAGGGRR